MPTENLIFIPKLSDRTLIDVFTVAAANYGKENFVCTTSAGTSIGSLPEEAINTEHQKQWELILSNNQMLITEISFTVLGGNFRIAFSRGGRNVPKSPIYDEVYFVYNEQGGEPSEIKRLELVTYFGKEFRAFDPKRTDVKSDTPEIVSTAALHESMLSRLEQLNEELIVKTSKARHDLEQTYANKKLELEVEIREEKELIYRQQNEALRVLKRREEELDKQKKAIDDRGNTHARRELRNNMLSDVKSRIEQFGVSKATQNKRTPIALILIATLLLLGSVIYSNLGEIHYLLLPAVSAGADTDRVVAANSKLLYILLARISFMTLAFTATAIYFVRWQNRWAEQHSSAEFQLQQFYIDVNRANWIIESGLEWKKETETEMPEAILSSVTRNLFKATDDVSQPVHPADELASALLGSASKLKIKSGENEMEFDNPSKIGKEAERRREKE